VSGWIDQLSNGQVTSVKVVLTTVLVVLAIYQVCLAAVFYKKVKVPVLAGRVAAIAHRSSGDAICVVAALIGLMCVSGYEISHAVEHGGTRVAAHIVVSTLLVVVLAVKVATVRFGGRRASRFLPYLGGSVLLLFAGSWATSSLFFLGG
jgi:Family of unknown function (DUF6529)